MQVIIGLIGKIEDIFLKVMLNNVASIREIPKIGIQRLLVASSI